MGCPPGKEMVQGYRKRDGTVVRSFCRDIRNHDTPEDRAKFRQNIKKAQEVLEEKDGYHFKNLN